MRSRWLRRGTIAVGISIPMFCAFTMLVHLPVVQAAMGWRRADGTGACPFGYDAPRIARAATLDATTHPALGFALGATTRADLEAWARDHRVACKPRRGQLECLDVPAELVAAHGAQLAGTTVWFELDPSGRLAGVKSARRTTDASSVGRAFTATEKTLGQRAGAPVVATGTPDELPRGAFRQATREYRTPQYRALVRATNMGDAYLLTESYSAL